MPDTYETHRARAAERYDAARRHRIAGREALARSLERSADAEIEAGLQLICAAQKDLLQIASDAQARMIADVARFGAGAA